MYMKFSQAHVLLFMKNNISDDFRGISMDHQDVLVDLIIEIITIVVSLTGILKDNENFWGLEFEETIPGLKSFSQN